MTLLCYPDWLYLLLIFDWQWQASCFDIQYEGVRHNSLSLTSRIICQQELFCVLYCIASSDAVYVLGLFCDQQYDIISVGITVPL